MSLDIGNYVVYCSKEICLIDSRVQKCFDGETTNDYFKLVPISSKNSAYYIPCENYQSKVRPLLTKDEIYTLIDEMPSASEKWCDDRNERKHMFNEVLRSDNYHDIISMMHSLYIKKDQQSKKGKKLLAADERAMNEAEHLVYQEFAFVLGINEEEVQGFIERRIDSLGS